MDLRRFNLYRYAGADTPPQLERGNLTASDVVLESLQPYHGALSWRSLTTGAQTTCLSVMGTRYIVLRLEDAAP